MLTKKSYQEPKVDITKLSACDVITTSGGAGDEPTEPPKPGTQQKPNWDLPWD